MERIEHMKDAVAAVADRMGGLRVVGYWTRRWPRILMYHRFSNGKRWRCMDVATFEAQIAYLRRHFCIVGMDDIAAFLGCGRSLPRRAVAVTVDDAFEDFFYLALPVLKKYRVPATLYVPTDFVDGKAALWPDRLLALLMRTRVREVRMPGNAGDGRLLALHTIDDRRMAWEALADYWIGVPQSVREVGIAELSAELCVSDLSPLPGDGAMSWEQIRAAAEAGVTIGAHSCTHPVMARETKAEQEWQARQSKARIEEMTGLRVRHFCYPHGRSDDHNATSIMVTRAAGYVTAVTAFADNRPLAGSHELRRFGAPTDEHLFRRTVWGVPLLRACAANGA